MRHNSVVNDSTHGLIHFPHLTMQVKSASSQASAKLQPVFVHDSITIPQMTTKTITAFVDHISGWNKTGTVTPVEKFTEAASLIISLSMSTIIDRKIPVRVTNTTESPCTINKNTQIAEFSVVTPEQSKFIKPVDTAILSMIPEYLSIPNNNYLVRKIGTNRTQILHRMRLRQFTPRQPIPDIPITPREWQPDPEVVITHDDLYARAWECEYDEPIFDSDYNNLATPRPPEITIRPEQAADEIRSTPGTTPGNSPEIIPQPDGSYDERDVDHDTQPHRDTSVEQLDPTPTNPRSSKYDLRHNPKPNCNEDY